MSSYCKYCSPGWRDDEILTDLTTSRWFDCFRTWMAPCVSLLIPDFLPLFRHFTTSLILGFKNQMKRESLNPSTFDSTSFKSSTSSIDRVRKPNLAGRPRPCLNPGPQGSAKRVGENDPRICLRCLLCLFCFLSQSWVADDIGDFRRHLRPIHSRWIL